MCTHTHTHTHTHTQSLQSFSTLLQTSFPDQHVASLQIHSTLLITISSLFIQHYSTDKLPFQHISPSPTDPSHSNPWINHLVKHIKCPDSNIFFYCTSLSDKYLFLLKNFFDGVNPHHSDPVARYNFLCEIPADKSGQ